MSPRPIVLDPDIQSLQDEGLSVEVVQGHLLVHQVPYVNAGGKVARGIMVTELAGNVGALGKPGSHQSGSSGEVPCHANGTAIKTLNRTEGPKDLWPGFTAQHHFSNKPHGEGDFPKTHSTKIRHYLALIAPEAAAVDPDATPYVGEPVVSFDPEQIFNYWDTASTRAGILAVTAKLANCRVAIVGLGGTGSYILDLTAKTPVREVHLFDGDLFEQHSAFRAPGAASIEEISARMPKVEYFAAIYAKMRKGIHPHSAYLDDENLSELDNFDFVFLCVDKGGVRKMLGEYLIARGIPFADTGMELSMLPEANAILGTCRATLCTAGKSDHFGRHAPQSDAPGDDLYRSNIQVADMNMLNAVLAVQLWKKHCTFYLDHWRPHHHTYSIDSASLTRDEALNLPPMKIKQIRPEYVEFIPERIEDGVLYISERYRTAVHKCCCGCGKEVVTPLSPAEWSVKHNGGRVSLWPSIGNWSYPCRSHYVIRDSRVLEAKAMTERQIQRVKANDRADKTAQIRRTNHAKEAVALAPKPNAQIAPTHEWQPSISWLKHLIRWWKSL